MSPACARASHASPSALLSYRTWPYFPQSITPAGRLPAGDALLARRPRRRRRRRALRQVRALSPTVWVGRPAFPLVHVQPLEAVLTRRSGELLAPCPVVPLLIGGGDSRLLSKARWGGEDGGERRRGDGVTDDSHADSPFALSRTCKGRRQSCRSCMSGFPQLAC